MHVFLVVEIFPLPYTLPWIFRIYSRSVTTDNNHASILPKHACKFNQRQLVGIIDFTYAYVSLMILMRL
jgi:hypothetical protein